MMNTLWQQNILTCRSIIQQNLGPQVVNIVSGSPSDQVYWQDRLSRTRRDVFRADAKTMILSSLEKSRKGNFLGSINAWIELHKALEGQELPPVILMNMVFGLGKRLSPFTQALINRKPAFPTPMRSMEGEIYLSTADAASMSATLWLHHLEYSGFKGIVIKWGDEAIIPGKHWETRANEYEDVDALRFIWQTKPTEDLAREKEWVEFDSQTFQMSFQFTRQGLEGLRRRLSERRQNALIGVNLGSLGISYRLMEVAEEVFRGDIQDENKWVDWDPYTWIALSCKDEAEWRAEKAYEERIGKSGIRDLEDRIPDFYEKIQLIKSLFQARFGRPLNIKVLDFGKPFWLDWGLHLSLRHSLEELTKDSDLGMALCELFYLPHERNKNGNILLRSKIPEGADIRDSLLVDTLITDTDSIIHSGVVVAGRHRRLEMPYGGSALFCAADTMRFTGPHAIAFKAIGSSCLLDKGDRLANLFFSDGKMDMRSNESVVDYEGKNYSSPVMGNPISFEEATRRMSSEDTRLVENRWLEQWSGWLR